MNAEQTVAVPAIGVQSSTVCIRSLGRRGISTIGIAQNTSAPALHSKHCSEAVITSGPQDDIDAYTATLLEVARRPDVKTIVPLREDDIYVLSKYRSKFDKYISTPWPDFETVRTSQDRLSLIELARDAGVAVPETELLTEWNEWGKRTIVKPRYSVIENDGTMVSPDVVFPTPGDPPNVSELIEEMGHEPIVQAYVPGTPAGNEHGFYALFDRGKPLAKFQHRRIRSEQYTGGASVYRKSIADPELEQAGMTILTALDWHGPAMVEFKRNTETDEFVLMEVNPRFWGSLGLGVAAGVDFPYLYYRLAVNNPTPTVPTYKEGIGCHLLKGELTYLLSLFSVDSDHVERPPRGRELYNVAASLLVDPRFDMFSVQDIKPFLWDLKNAGATVLESTREF